jgi:hypothetical protein
LLLFCLLNEERKEENDWKSEKGSRRIQEKFKKASATFITDYKGLKALRWTDKKTVEASIDFRSCGTPGQRAIKALSEPGGRAKVDSRAFWLWTRAARRPWAFSRKAN